MEQSEWERPVKKSHIEAKMENISFDEENWKYKTDHWEHQLLKWWTLTVRECELILENGM